MLKGPQVFFGLIGGMVCPIALAVLGYFTIFQGLDWIYLVIVFGIYLVCVALVVLAFPKDGRYAAYCEMMGGGFGWVWMLSIIATIWFVISALFMDGSWWEVGYSFLVGGLCKGWTRSFMEAQREQDIENVVSEFGQVMENLDWLLAFHDVGKLPYPKETILNSIVSAYKLTADENMKEILKSGLLALSHFQENIGDSPVKGAVDLTQINIDELSPEKYLAMNEGIDKEKYEHLSQQADKEYQGYIELL